MAFIFDSFVQDTIMLQDMLVQNNKFEVIKKDLSTAILNKQFDNSFKIYDATFFLMTIIKNEMIWKIISTTGNDFVIIADHRSIENHNQAEKIFPYNESFFRNTNYIVYGKIIIVEKRLLAMELQNEIVPFDEWIQNTTVLKVNE